MPETCRDLTDAEQKVVREVLDEGVLVSGLVPIGGETWAIYGSIPVDGEVIVAEFDNRADAESALEQIGAAERDNAPFESSPIDEKGSL
ncbi:MAG TPA: hypothetical protein VFZ97_01560 [Acidimicrobiales bacterium]